MHIAHPFLTSSSQGTACVLTPRPLSHPIKAQHVRRARPPLPLIQSARSVFAYTPPTTSLIQSGRSASASCTPNRTTRRSAAAKTTATAAPTSAPLPLPATPRRGLRTGNAPGRPTIPDRKWTRKRPPKTPEAEEEEGEGEEEEEGAEAAERRNPERTEAEVRSSSSSGRIRCWSIRGSTRRHGRSWKGGMEGLGPGRGVWGGGIGSWKGYM